MLVILLWGKPTNARAGARLIPARSCGAGEGNSEISAYWRVIWVVVSPSPVVSLVSERMRNRLLKVLPVV